MRPEERQATQRAAATLFDAGRYLAAHELFEELWESTEGKEADFYKGLLQAAIALHHFDQGNLEGAAKLYSGHRRCLAGYQPAHGGVAVTRFLAEMQAFLGPALEGTRAGGLRADGPSPSRPRLLPGEGAKE